jgi:hypothetical protein
MMEAKVLARRGRVMAMSMAYVMRAHYTILHVLDVLELVLIVGVDHNLLIRGILLQKRGVLVMGSFLDPLVVPIIHQILIIIPFHGA